MSMADINAYRAAMINGTPETLHWYLTVTRTLTGCTLSNSAAQVEYGDSYTATVTPESGKTLDSVVVMMGGVNITSAAVTGGAISIPKVTGAVTITAVASMPSVAYSVVLNLTNAASSNAATSVAEGAAYTTTLSPTGTYKKLGTIIVKMGGVDVSASVVSGNTVTIANVTGDITITCAAVITNIIDTVGISANTRLSTSSGVNKAKDGWATMGANMDVASLIHLVPGDTLRVKGVSIPAANDGSSAVVKYNSDGTFFSATYMYEGNAFSSMTFHNTANGIVITTHDPQYIRISPICADASAVIMTINEEIP